MDVRLSPEQEALRDSVTQAVGRLGPRAVADLDDGERRAKIDAAVEASGWRELRSAAGDGGAWASGVEVAIVAEELARGLADTPFVGPTLAAELRRLFGGVATGRETVALGADLSELGDATAVDAAGASLALGQRHGEVLELPLGTAAQTADLTRHQAEAGQAGTPIGAVRLDDLERWTALGLAITCADLVGVMRGAVELGCAHAKERRQFGVAIGSFQAVQHLLADAHVSAEGSRSVMLHAAWAVDALAPAEALAAAASAKAYCARAARDVCEATIQVHGGIGNTWECMAHVFLRRALVSAELLGGVGPSLERVLSHHGLRQEGLAQHGGGGGDGLR
jgi:Acyl-CoA dehydrogenase, C-terminal domain